MNKLSWRFRTYELLEANNSWLSQLINGLLMLLIMCNVAAVVAESMRDVYLAYGHQFYYFELISVIIFSLEYGLRVWCSPENPEYAALKYPRWSFALSGMSIVDFLAIAPFYLSMFIGIDARVLRGLRLLRLFKLTRYSGSMELMVTVLKKEAGNIGSAVFVMLILIIIAASAVYVVERDVQPVAFGSIPAALWWASVTLTTVGYGDVIPLTLMGRVFGAILMIIGVGLAALPAGILAAGYSRELLLRRETFESELRKAYDDGKFSNSEKSNLEYQREALGLTEEEVAAMAKLMEGRHLLCPHCGKSVNVHR